LAQTKLIILHIIEKISRNFLRNVINDDAFVKLIVNINDSGESS